MLRIKTKEKLNHILELLSQLHTVGRNAFTPEILQDCQNAAIAAGERLEKELPDRRDLVAVLEEYCEAVYQFSQEPQEDTQLVRMNTLIDSVRQNIEELPVVREIAFFPYKASMWDSLESVYLAAKEDPECEAYCVPIPYFEKNEDQSLGMMHYEGNLYPDYVEITDWESYDFEERRPDVMYIHNPYDEYNRVTSVHPRYYSANLKKYTDTLVYIPYYSTAGGMAEAQRLCSAYMNADYIVIQSPAFRKYFDERIPDKKFLPLGSPKFDRIIRKCQNPSQPPAEWKVLMEGKKVYFYNTSLNGMLADTESFLKKMEYVFHCFEGKKDACLLWRPHPLFESTIESMRPSFIAEYERIKQIFFEKKLGIYDTTPDIDNAIVYSDAYIGDAASSVLSLFGIVGKPVFVLNNEIHHESNEEEWKSEIQFAFNWYRDDKWVIAQGNKLYASENGDYSYKFYCDLSKYAYGNMFISVVEIGGKLYAVPRNGLEILVIQNKNIIERIELKPFGQENNLFTGAWVSGPLLICVPREYPYMVVYDTKTKKMKYIDGIRDVFIANIGGTIRAGGQQLFEGKMYFASPNDGGVCIVDLLSERQERFDLNIPKWRGCRGILEKEGDLWLLPYEGFMIVCWNPTTGNVRCYQQFPPDFTCLSPVNGVSIEEQPFYWAAFAKNYMYLIPRYGDMHLKLNIQTGDIQQWKLPLPEETNGELVHTGIAGVFRTPAPEEKWTEVYKYFSYSHRKLYAMNLEEETAQELPFSFDKAELKKHEPGFAEISPSVQYGCCENAFNSLSGFLNGEIIGADYSKERQLQAYQAIAANSDGTCGYAIYEKVKSLSMLADI